MAPPDPDNRGRSRPVALVTGASRGIGRATAIDLAAAGFDLAITARTVREGDGRSDTDPDIVLPGSLDSSSAMIEEAGGAVLAIAMDLLDRSAVVEAADRTVSRFGRLDVLVNNAIYQGVGGMELIADIDEPGLRNVIEGNVFAQVALVRAAMPHLLTAGGGTIVNMISSTGYVDPPAPSGSGGWGLGYAMSKAAFGRVTPLVHVEYAGQGIRVFSVDPGLTVTEKMIASGRAEQYLRHFAAATPDVIGRAIRWLVTCPDESEDLRGQVVLAQREVARRGLLPGWPPPRPTAARPEVAS